MAYVSMWTDLSFWETLMRGNLSVQERKGEWYVYRQYLGYENYLHHDGVWRNSTLHQGKWSGYFTTKQSADEALKVQEVLIHA